MLLKEVGPGGPLLGGGALLAATLVASYAGIIRIRFNGSPPKSFRGLSAFACWRRSPVLRSTTAEGG
jgi:hypothetical protein